MLPLLKSQYLWLWSLFTGTYSHMGAVQCLPCPEGAACPNTITTESCQEGEYSGHGDHMCHTCPSGSYCPGGAATPSICPEGTYSRNGSTLCSLCPAGKKVTFWLHLWVTCKFKRNFLIVGHMCPNSGQEPIECPVGFYSVGNTTTCLTCPAGYTCLSTSTIPVACSLGYYSLEGNANCTQCEAGYACEDSKSPPRSCDPGMLV